MTFTFYIESQATDVRDLTVNRLKMGTLEILVPYDTSVGVGNSFELKENSTTLLKGKIIRVRDQAIVGVEKKILTCLDSTHTLYEKYCIEYGYHEYYDGNGGYDAGWIAKDLVDHYFSGILTSNNIDTTTGVTVVRIEFDGKTVGAALEELAKRAHCYFYVDNANDVHFFIAESVSSGKTIQGTDLSKIRVTDESIRHIKRVIVRGRHRAIQASAGSGYPEAFYQDNRIICLGEAQEVADALKLELDKDRQQTELTLPNFLEVRPGETLVLNSPDHGFNNETLPTQKVKWVFSPTREKTILTVGDEQPTLNSILASLMRGINWEPEIQEDLGYVDIGLPIYDPSHFVDDRYEEGYNDWSEGTTFKEPGYALSIYRLTKIAVVARFIADAPATGELEIKIEYSFNQGANWYLFGTVISVTSDQWAEYTRTDDILGDISQQMWIRFSYRVGQTGEGAVHGYVKECELRTRYKKTRWEVV